jgi:hypothetical protein
MVNPNWAGFPAEELVKFHKINFKLINFLRPEFMAEAQLILIDAFFGKKRNGQVR